MKKDGASDTFKNTMEGGGGTHILTFDHKQRRKKLRNNMALKTKMQI